MSVDRSEMLKVLFAMEQTEVDRDLISAKERITEIIEEIRSLGRLSGAEKTAKTEARRAHLMMVQAHELCRKEIGPPELQTFYAAFGAGNIAQEAEMVTADKPTLTELSFRMDEIRRREGLAQGEYWMAGDGPADHQKLEDEWNDRIEAVADTIFVFVLTRYRLQAQASLYERNRKEFEILREIGRRLIWSTSTDSFGEGTMDEYFRKEWGEDAFRRVERRVEELRREEA